MPKLVFVENSFQLQLAKEIEGAKKIFYLGNSFSERILKIPTIIILIFKNKTIYIYDHRNPVLIIALTINYVRKRNIYVADEGFHSIMVDIYSNKYLYRQSHRLKKIMIRLYEKQILKINRFKQIEYGFKKKIEPIKSSVGVFVDQLNFEIILKDQIKEIKKKYKYFEYAKHPRNTKYGIFTYSRIPFEDLLKSETKRDFYGVYSTGLIYALKNNHNVFLIKIESIESKINRLEVEYIKDIQKLLLNMGAIYIV